MAPIRPAWRHPRVLFLLFAAMVALAFISLRYFGGGSGSVLEDAFHSVGIFTTNGSWAFDPSNHANLFYKILATAMPIVTFIGFVELLTGGVFPFLIRQRSFARLYFGAHGTIVCGLTEQSLTFARAVARKRVLVFLFDDAPDEALAERAYRAGIPVLPLRRLDHHGHSALMLKRCDLFSFLPSTDQQVDLVSRIDARLDGPTDKSFWFLMHERGLSQRLDGYLRFTANNSTLHPRFFDIDVLTARQVLEKHRLDILADVADQKQIHLAIVGFGALGRAIVKEAARLMVTLPSIEGVLLRVTAIDIDADKGAAALEAEDPQIRQLLDLGTIDLRLQPAGLNAAQLAMLPDDVTAYFITVGNTEIAFATAVSLRHWLLEPPAEMSEVWRQSHGCAPILIRVRDWKGLGRLIRSNVDWSRPDASEPISRTPELPDGIFGFGVAEDILDPAFIMAAPRETGARVLHQAYRDKRETLQTEWGGMASLRAAEREWRELAADLRDLNLYGYDHIPIKARAIGHRVVCTDAQPGKKFADGAIPPSVLPYIPLLSRLEHHRYLAERVAGGWRYASTRCDELRLHPALIDWSELPHTEQSLDENHVRSMMAALHQSRRRMLPALVIGVAGQRSREHAAERDGIARMRRTLDSLVQANPQSAPMLMTTLSPGIGMDAAEAANALSIPWSALLPLPFELYREDFAHDERRRLQAVIASAELYVELPLRFGRASELTRGHTRNLARRAEQYAHADAFIVERSHALILDAATDSQAAAWWSGETAIPERYRTGAVFLPRSERMRSMNLLAV